VGLLGITHAEARVTQQVKDLVRDTVPPPEVPPDVLIAASPVVYAEASREGETALKYDLTLHLPGVDTIQAGGSFRTFGLDYEGQSPYGNDTPYAPEPGLDPLDFAERFRAYQSSAYAQVTTSLTPRLALTAGGRFDHYQYLGQHRFSPRGGLSFALSDRLSWRFSAGVYYQPPAFLFASSLPENRGLKPWRSNHVITGLAWSPQPGLRVSAEIYKKTYREYPVAAELPTVSLANIGDTFDVRSILFRLVSAGQGYAEGLEFFVEKRLAGGIYGQANLAFSRTRHAGLDGVLRSGSFDYPHVFNLTGGYQLTTRWDVSARASVLSGRPYTPYDEAVSMAQRRGVYDLERVNALRGPDYIRIDLRGNRRLTVRGQDLNVFFGVQNITNRRNLAGYSWNRRSNTLQVSEQQGVFPIIGFNWRF
jgi:outer membrane receptor protein involved in Fe transport